MTVLELICNDNFIAVNKTLIKTFGIEPAILLGELASECNYWQKQGKTENGYFYSTVENVEDKTTLTAYQQRKALALLKSKGVIDVISKKGIPPKRYIKVFEDTILQFLNVQKLKNFTFESENNSLLNSEFFNISTNNNITNNNIYKNDIYNEPKPKKTHFEPPTVEQVQAYCDERNNDVDAQRFVDYYAARGWELSKGRKVKDWQACVRTWEKNSYGKPVNRSSSTGNEFLDLLNSMEANDE